ncbi:hypothetical protein GALL_431840 [mine drainage metagenome]|uniref:Uncharacterized protein n=1 Tax=mine drainage metagenome TaxID=410659 RepID=A0A1J5PUK7_9ZZZZ
MKLWQFQSRLLEIFFVILWNCFNTNVQFGKPFQRVQK